MASNEVQEAANAIPNTVPKDVKENGTKQVDPELIFTKQEKIGQGGFGEVFKAINKQTQQVVAIKIIDLEEVSEEIEDIRQEIMVLSQCDSPYVTKYYGSYLKGPKLWIIMEYLGGGSALDLMKATNFQEVHIAIVLRDVLRGLDYLHSERKVHRDIKAANILLSEIGEVKLADFGVAGQLTNTTSKRNSLVGTPFWMAPEVICRSAYDSKADIWSLGITAIELAKGKAPHSDLHPMKVLLLIPKSNPPQLNGNYSKQFRELVEACLNKDPANRPTAKELLKFPFIRKAKKNSSIVDLIEKYQRWKEHESGIFSDSEASDSEDFQSNDSWQTFRWDLGTLQPPTTTLDVKITTPLPNNEDTFTSTPQDNSLSPNNKVLTQSHLSPVINPCKYDWYKGGRVLRPTSMPCSNNKIPWAHLSDTHISPIGDEIEQQHWIILSNSDFLSNNGSNNTPSVTTTASTTTNHSNDILQEEEQEVVNNFVMPLSPTYQQPFPKPKSSNSNSTCDFLCQLINELKVSFESTSRNDGTISELRNAFVLAEQASPGMTDTFVKEVFRRLVPSLNGQRKFHTIMDRLKKGKP